MGKIGLKLAVRGICCQISDLLLTTAVRRIKIRSELSTNQRF